MSATAERVRVHRASTLQMVPPGGAASFPPGVVGQVEGIALVYDVVDTYETTFARGCLDRTVRERVAAGKVRLFLDHGDMPVNGGMYDTHLHIGVVRAVWDVALPDGTHGAKFRADLFDTEAWRSAHEYLRAIASTGSETGVSIGMLFRPETTRAVLDGHVCERIAEVPLGEISITALSSVPGTKVTEVRAALVRDLAALLKDDEACAQVRALIGDAPPTPDSDAAHGAPVPADSDAASGDSPGTPTDDVRPDPTPSTDERLAWCRANLTRLYHNGTSH